MKNSWETPERKFKTDFTSLALDLCLSSCLQYDKISSDRSPDLYDAQNICFEYTNMQSQRPERNKRMVRATYGAKGTLPSLAFCEQLSGVSAKAMQLTKHKVIV